jgi:hypothetical protein
MEQLNYIPPKTWSEGEVTDYGGGSIFVRRARKVF